MCKQERVFGSTKGDLQTWQVVKCSSGSTGGSGSGSGSGSISGSGSGSGVGVRGGGGGGLSSFTLSTGVFFLTLLLLRILLTTDEAL